MRNLRTPMRKTQRKLKLKCMGGPFDGETIELSDTVPICSAYFNVPSYGSETGRYVRDREYTGQALWQTR